MKLKTDIITKVTMTAKNKNTKKLKICFPYFLYRFTFIISPTDVITRFIINVIPIKISIILAAIISPQI